MLRWFSLLTHKYRTTGLNILDMKLLSLKCTAHVIQATYRR